MSKRITMLNKMCTETMVNRLVAMSADDDLIFYTSGTTGKEKSIVHSAITMKDNAIAFNETMSFSNEIVMYHCLPLDYMAGFLNTLICPLEAGGRVVIAGSFSPVSFWKDVVENGCNAVWVTPTIAKMLIMMNRSESDAKEWASQLDYIFCGMAPLPYKVRKDWLDIFGVPLQASYGTSELLIASAQTRLEAYERHDCGKAINKVRVNGDENGEITIETPFACWEKDGIPYRTRSNVYPTGDLGSVTDGYVTITGRKRDIIKRGGVLIDPSVIEELARRVKGVNDAAVVGVEHDVYGEDIHLFVEALYCDGLEDFLKSSLDKQMVPDKIYMLDKLPRTESGKIKRTELREMVKSYQRA